MNDSARRGWRHHPVVGRSAWTLLDQAASSGSNFLLAICILSTADRREFAAFSVVVTGYLLVTQLTRSAFSLPILILYSDDQGTVGNRSGQAVAASVATGVIGAIVFAAAAHRFEPGRTMFLILACALPLLQYQDAVRHVAFAGALPKVAAKSDSLWVGIQVVGTVAAAAAGVASPAVLLLIWAAGGCASGLIFGARLGVVPRFAHCGRWLNDNRDLCRRLAAEFLLNSGSYYAISYGLVAIAGADQLGRWRAAQALIGPVTVVLLGGATLGVPESARVREREASLWRFAGLLSVGLVAMALAGGFLAYVLLPAVGPGLFPDTWRTARPVLPVLTLYAAAAGASIGAVSALRARGHVGWIVRSRAVSGAVGLAVGLALASGSGATGALVGLGLSEAGFALAAWLRLRSALAAPISMA